MLALILVAISVGLSNLAASIGLGASGIDRRTRVRVLVIFGLLEAGMPIVGLLIGHGLASAVGRRTTWIAAALLVAIGSYGMVKAVRAGGLGGTGRASARRRRDDGAPRGGGQDVDQASPGRPERTGRELVRITVTGFALSLDNLVAGFALGTYRVNIIAGVIVFGTVSTVMSLAGLEFGARIGQRAGERGELLGAVVLVGVGLAIGFGAFG
jgi:manganese efflux pump family protein